MTPSPSVERPQESAELTDEQVRWVMGNVARWLDLKRQWEKRGFQPSSWDQALGALIPDVTHSALLYRLLHGREPLPEPPSTEGAYPVYPDQDEYGWRASAQKDSSDD